MFVAIKKYVNIWKVHKKIPVKIKKKNWDSVTHKTLNMKGSLQKTISKVHTKN